MGGVVGGSEPIADCGHGGGVEKGDFLGVFENSVDLIDPV